jgi:hypothetical protein
MFEIGDNVSELEQDELDSLVERKLVSVDVVKSKVIEDPSEQEQEQDEDEDEDEPKNENE